MSAKHPAETASRWTDHPFGHSCQRCLEIETYVGATNERIAELEAVASAVCNDASRSTAKTGEGEALVDVRESLIEKLQAALNQEGSET